ncbi:R8 protein [Coemansia sp. RSA 552]|nr:R8 protein [Coemansia sp. RSA 552]
MFYSHDLLCRRSGRFAAIWLLAVAPARSRRICLSPTEIANISIRHACAEIAAPPTPLSLRLSSMLLVGLARALSRKSHALLTDCQAADGDSLGLEHVSEASFRFDDDGNVFFALSDSSAGPHGFSTAEVHTEILDIRPPSSPARTDSHAGAKVDGLASEIQPAALLPNAPNQDRLLCAPDPPHAAHPLDIIVAEPTSNEPDRRPTKRRRVDRGYVGFELANDTDALTYVPRVTSLWRRSCYWDRSMRSKVAAALGLRAQKRVHARATALATVGLFVNTQVLDEMLGSIMAPDSAATGTAIEPSAQPHAPNTGHSEDDGPLPFGQDVESDIELGRAGSPVSSRQARDEHEFLDMNLDIPWLNPDMLNEIQQRQRSSLGHSPYMAVEPSASHWNSADSRQSTPASRVPSLDPPSSDDGLEVRSFELAAPNLEQAPAASETLDVHGLESFLDTTEAGIGDTSSLAATMNHEAECFHRFVLAQMHSHGVQELGFGQLLPSLHRSRRVAARAFVDLLQMASRSVFGLGQPAPFTEIVIVQM